MYVAVRADLPLRAQFVQSIHAGIEAALRWPTRDPWLVAITVPDAEALVQLHNRLTVAGIRAHLFYEPDDGLGVTALATCALDGEQRRLLRRERLWAEPAV